MSRAVTTVRRAGSAPPEANNLIRAASALLELGDAEAIAAGALALWCIGRATEGKRTADVEEVGKGAHV